MKEADGDEFLREGPDYKHTGHERGEKERGDQTFVQRGVHAVILGPTTS